MKYIIGLFVAIVIIFILLVFYQNIIAPKSYQEELNKRDIYHKIKKVIKRGTVRKEVYDVLNKKYIKYHNDKNRNIDITGKGITIEINNMDEVYRIVPY